MLHNLKNLNNGKSETAYNLCCPVSLNGMKVFVCA